jgi:hypothetical protein
MLPPTLEDRYADLLTNITPENRLLARQALLWLTSAKRPLLLEELNEAIIVQDDQAAIDEEDRLCHPGLIPEICRGLIDHHSGYISLAHSSVARFLLTPDILSHKAAYFALKPDEGDRVLMRMCLQYLSMDFFASGPCTTMVEFASRFQSYPLLSYAAACWATHANSFELNQADINSIMKFLQTRHLPIGGNYCAWIQVLLPETDMCDVGKLQATHPLYYAASFGLAKIVQLILENDKDVDVDARGGRRGSTPLFVACWRGYYDVARILVSAGADPTLVDRGCGLDVFSFLRLYEASSSEACDFFGYISDKAEGGSVADTVGLSICQASRLDWVLGGRDTHQACIVALSGSVSVPMSGLPIQIGRKQAVLDNHYSV